MRQKIFGIVILCISFFLSSSITHAQSQQWNVTSPDDSVVITVALSAQGQLTYEVRKQNQLVLESSSLGLTTSSQNFTTGLSFVSQTPETINQTYSLKSGKKSSVSVNANQLTLRFTNANNQAIARARGEILMLLNSDTLVSPGAIDQLYETLTQSSRQRLGILAASSINSWSRKGDLPSRATHIVSMSTLTKRSSGR